jgi:hypothetical protein
MEGFEEKESKEGKEKGKQNKTKQKQSWWNKQGEIVY